MFSSENPGFAGHVEKTSSGRAVAVLCALVAQLATGCSVLKEDSSAGQDTASFDSALRVGDSGADQDTAKDSSRLDSSESGDGSEKIDTADSGDTGNENTESDCTPHNTSAWPTSWTTEWGTSFRDNGGSELSGITGIAGPTVDLPVQVIYGGGDNGVLYEMDGDFTFLRSWALSTPDDIEGIGVDALSGEFFTMDEDVSDVDGWIWTVGVDPVKTSTDCTLNIPTDTANNLGIEGFTFLSADEAPAAWMSESWADARGYLLAGSQTDSNVGVFPIGLCTSDAVLDPVLSLPSSNTDIAGLATLQGNLYVLHDSANTVDVIDLSTQVTTSTYTLPTNGQEEGIWLKLNSCDAVNGNASMYIADDVSGEIHEYVVPVDSAY